MKILFSLFFFVAFANIASAQNDTDNTNEVGEAKTRDEREDTRRFGAQILAGFNAAQLDGDGMADFNHLGINAGLRAFVRISPKFTTSVDILYAQTGAQAGRLYSSPFRTINLNYIQVPVMVHYANWRWQVGTGLSYNNLLNAQFIEFTSGKDLMESSYAAVPRNFDVTAHLEATFFFTKKWGLNMQYSRSLMNIDSRSPVFTDVRYNNVYLYSYYITARALYNL
jgi:hypothetical protein